jgi:uncharacterized protein YecT (DUF1311 family)
MRSLLIAGAVLATVAGHGAWAKDSPSKEDKLDTAAFKQCWKKTDDVESEMRACYDDELLRQDAVLNVTYQDAMAKLNPVQQKALRDGERAWIKHRDHVCQTSFTDEGAADQATDIASCQVAETETRILYLRKAAH